VAQQDWTATGLFAPSATQPPAPPLEAPQPTGAGQGDIVQPAAPEAAASPEAPGKQPHKQHKRRHQWHHKAASALGFEPPKRHLGRGATIGLICGAVVLLVGVAFGVFALTGGLDPDQPEPTVEQPTQPSPGASGATRWSVGRTFEAGDFTVKVVSYADRIDSLGPNGSLVAENGQWVLLEVTVKNVGGQEGTFVPDQQVLTTLAGKEYVDDPASALAHAEFTLGTAPIKPGAAQTGLLAFDIPLDDSPAALRFVGRVGEAPITVPLG
jgi:hypothetical protein